MCFRAVVLGGEKRIMVVGTTLIKLDGAVYYSPSFPRGGLAATFAVDTTHFEGLTDLTITVEHRDEHDVSFTSAGAFSAITAAGHSDKDISDIKQIVRFAYALNGGSATDGVHIVMQAPSWRPYP
jgi:hypothetical protein